MANDGTAGGIVAAGVAINAVSAIQRGKDITSTLWAGCAFAVICVTLNTFTKNNIGTGLALLFLLSSFLMNGTRIFDTTNKLIEGSKKNG